MFNETQGETAEILIKFIKLVKRKPVQTIGQLTHNPSPKRKRKEKKKKKKHAADSRVLITRETLTLTIDNQQLTTTTGSGNGQQTIDWLNQRSHTIYI